MKPYVLIAATNALRWTTEVTYLLFMVKTNVTLNLFIASLQQRILRTSFNKHSLGQSGFTI